MSYRNLWQKEHSGKWDFETIYVVGDKDSLVHDFCYRVNDLLDNLHHLNAVQKKEIFDDLHQYSLKVGETKPSEVSKVAFDDFLEALNRFDIAYDFYRNN